MSRFLLGALTMGAVFAFTSFALHDAPTPASRTTVPLKLSDLTLDRVFRAPVALTTATPTFTTMPPNLGLVITHITPANISTLLVSINAGPTESIGFTGGPIALDPPIIVHPGDTLSLTGYGGAGGYSTFAGYYTYPGET